MPSEAVPASNLYQAAFDYKLAEDPALFPDLHMHKQLAVLVNTVRGKQWLARAEAPELVFSSHVSTPEPTESQSRCTSSARAPRRFHSSGEAWRLVLG